jgi:hypothetical protein
MFSRDHYQNSWILPEECIFSSQPSAVLLDMEKEMETVNKLDSSLLSLIIDEDKSDKVSHPIHGRPDCVVHPFKIDPKLHCATCFCVICEVEAAQCMHWVSHCKAATRIVKNVAVKKTKVKGSKKVATQNTKDIANLTKKAASLGKKASAASISLKNEKAIDETDEKEPELKKNGKACSTDDPVEKKATAEVVKKEVIKNAVDCDLKGYLISILEMSTTDLKAICKEKGILPGGSASLKHKYAFVLFRDALMK